MPGISVDPFPHVVMDGLWDEVLLKEVADEFPQPADPRWRLYNNDKEGKFEGSPIMWGPTTWRLAASLGSPQFCRLLEDTFGIDKLTMQTKGGGYHLIPPGGRLGVHADFNRGDDGLYRRLNLLVFLNNGWTEADGGQLELWDEKRCAVEILPVLNRTVIFATSSTSYHGHPDPLPGPRWRKSFAVYYFAPTPAPDYQEDHSTVFRDTA